MKPFFKLPIDRRAWPLTLVIVLAYAVLPHPVWLNVFFGVLLAAHLAFFRDPERTIPAGDALLAPSDGLVVEVSEVLEPRYLKEEAVLIGVFLSVLDPHVNRSPMGGAVDFVEYKKGQFLNALKVESKEFNESNALGISEGTKKILVKQIAGAIARRICCDVKKGESLTRGERFGIICYGSRAELYVPKRLFRSRVQKGQRIKAGQTVMGDWISGS